MNEKPTHIQELTWLASYYERFGSPKNARLILEALEKTEHVQDQWAPIRHIEAALRKEQRKSA